MAQKVFRYVRKDFHTKEKITWTPWVIGEVQRKDFSEWEHYDSKLENSIARSKGMVYEYAMCNDFDYFVTLTLDKRKFDRHNLPNYRKKLTQFIRDYRKKYDTDIQYLLIPEMHIDGAWHMHGLLSGFLPDLYVNNYGYLGWKSYEERFGYISLGEITSKERVASYITKYITKDMSNRVTELGAHLYYASRGLKKADIIERGYTSDILADRLDYKDKFCAIQWLAKEMLKNDT